MLSFLRGAPALHHTLIVLLPQLTQTNGGAGTFTSDWVSANVRWGLMDRLLQVCVCVCVYIERVM